MYYVVYIVLFCQLYIILYFILQHFHYLGPAHQVFILWSCASSLYTLFSFISFRITSLHLSFRFPIFRRPLTYMLSLLGLTLSFKLPMSLEKESSTLGISSHVNGVYLYVCTYKMKHLSFTEHSDSFLCCWKIGWNTYFVYTNALYCVTLLLLACLLWRIE